LKVIVALVLVLNVHILIAYLLEKLILKEYISEKFLTICSVINTGVLILFPIVYVYLSNIPIVSGIILLSISIIIFLKTISYTLVNRDFRTLEKNDKPCYEPDVEVIYKNLIIYPNNVNLSNLYYFMICPVLCYQLNYPRSSSIRWYWLAGKVGQCLFLSIFMIILTEQWILPTIRNTVRYMDSFDLIRIFQRCLKLSIPSVVIWLMGFYNFFHLWLNILAELLHFGDREFYRSWWNSTTQGEYWRDWNTPVHNWLRRHVYYPAVRFGLTKIQAAFLIFFISAVFHEIVASVPLKMIRLYFFFGMMLQVPLIIFTEKRTKGDQLGNFIFWISFCILGQPIGLLFYYYDYVSRAAALNNTILSQ